jgi:hypothetical protein
MPRETDCYGVVTDRRAAKTTPDFATGRVYWVFVMSSSRDRGRCQRAIRAIHR